MSSQRGQATLEFALTFAMITMPMTAAIIFTSQLLWVWHSVTEWTRAGAQYAVTHCWNGSGGNVMEWMRGHVPPNVDSDQFGPGGSAVIEVRYFQRNAETGQMEDFACEGAECSTECIPDAVTVRVTGYDYRRVLSTLGVPPVPLPDFRTSLAMESAGCSPGATECLQ